MKQYLTKTQLITLYNSFTCYKWREGVATILKGHEFDLVDTKIEIQPEYISRLINKGTDDQKSLVLDCGIVLKKDLSVSISGFNCANGERGSILLERRESGTLKGKSFYLNSDFDWSLVKDKDGVLCLVPTYKENDN